MSLQSALYEWLKSKTAVTAIVGTGTNAKIYPDLVPQGTAFPFLVFQRVSNIHEHHMRAAAGLVRCDMQISCWDDDRKGAFDLAEVVRGALDGFIQGTFGAGSETLYVASIALTNELDSIEEPQDGSDRGGYRVLQDYSIWYRESVPTPQA